MQDSHGNDLSLTEAKLTCTGSEPRRLGLLETLKLVVWDGIDVHQAYKKLTNEGKIAADQTTPVEFDLGDFPSPLQKLCDRSKDDTPQK